MGDALARQDSGDETAEFRNGLANGYLNTDLNSRFIKHKAATYLCPAPDDGIEGIFLSDTLIIDRSLKPEPGRVVMAVIDGEYCLRRLVKERGRLLLVDDKGFVSPRVVTDEEYYQGTVTHNVHSLSW